MTPQAGGLAVNDNEVVWRCRCEHHSLLIKKQPSSPMIGTNGNPQARNLFKIIGCLQERKGLRFKIRR